MMWPEAGKPGVWIQYQISALTLTGRFRTQYVVLKTRHGMEDEWGE